MYRRRRRKHRLGRVMESSGWGGHNWRRERENRSFYGEGPMCGCHRRGHEGVGPGVLWRWAVSWLTQNDGKGLTDWFRYFLRGGGAGGRKGFVSFLWKWQACGGGMLWVGACCFAAQTHNSQPDFETCGSFCTAVPPGAAAEASAQQRRCTRSERVSEEGARGTLLEAVSCLFNEIIFQN